MTVNANMPKKSEIKSNPFHGTLQTISYILSVFVFIYGVKLFGISVWSLIRKIPYYILLDVKVDITYFTIPVAVLCIPVFWIFVSTKWGDDRFYLFYIVTTLQIISILLLIAAPNLGFTYTYIENGATKRFVSSLDKLDLNNSLLLSLSKYDTSKTIQFAWNHMQNQLDCCGVNNADDWMISGHGISSSCCQNDNFCYKNNTFSQGCLDALCRDLFWHKSILISQCYAGIIVHSTAVIIAGVTYLSAKQFQK